MDGYQISVMADADIVEAVYVSSSSWSMILDYNVEYAASIVSINCVGESNEISLRNILLGKTLAKADGHPPNAKPKKL